MTSDNLNSIEDALEPSKVSAFNLDCINENQTGEAIEEADNEAMRRRCKQCQKTYCA